MILAKMFDSYHNRFYRFPVIKTDCLSDGLYFIGLSGFHDVLTVERTKKAPVKLQKRFYDYI